ncbi:glycerophosphoryl diester phosphodiesterase membrane domain-containing protein [Caulobacter hibisci]|uniref:Glycerophosphoryl diester phosphodiesterase membrane domain-containing protein n=1 Tax=Caulobacter hibisci TaxID=2035993 RepID=A0ABS0ST27_9CAUL|nr:glycerophosphoryl diester phosphodiesterase membrane domain-containing protein [Caulobacter hibisci]MBI1682706.1 glycerophosphoryl diester phosphodiesterase membrane domain-containing protein [Caulobacter hibisci]
MADQDSAGGRFDFGRVIQNTFKVIVDNIGLFGGGALLLVTAPSLVGTLSGLIASGGTVAPAGIVIGAIISGLGSFALQGVVVRAAVGTLNGAPVAPREAASSGLRFLLPLIGLAIIATLGIWLGMLLLVVPGIILSVMWTVAAPTLVVEKKGVFASLGRSRDLTRGSRWPIFGLFVVYFIASIILSLIIQAIGTPLGAVAGNVFALQNAELSVGLVVFVLISALVNGVQGVVIAAGVSATYYELRTNKEGAAPDQTAAVFD